MNRIQKFFLVALIAMVAACAGQAENPLSDMRELTPATMLDSPEPVANTSYSPEQINHGRYLVELLGCASCHTDGALVGEPDFQRHLAGSSTGIAYSNPMAQRNPGVVYPPNLTPDPETGLGNWTDAAMINMIRSGTTPTGGHSLPIMPWPAYSKITDSDIQAMVAYLRSLPPVRHRVPDNVAPGRQATAPFVYFGVYQSRH